MAKEPETPAVPELPAAKPTATPARKRTTAAKPPVKEAPAKTPAAKKAAAAGKRAPKKSADATSAPATLEERLVANERLLAAHKLRHAYSLRDPTPENVGVLAQIIKLERDIEQTKTLIRLRELTREPPRPPS